MQGIQVVTNESMQFRYLIMDAAFGTCEQELQSE